MTQRSSVRVLVVGRSSAAEALREAGYDIRTGADVVAATAAGRDVDCVERSPQPRS